MQRQPTSLYWSAMRNAARAIRRGDIVEAERWTRIVDKSHSLDDRTTEREYRREQHFARSMEAVCRMEVMAERISRMRRR